MLPTTVIIHVLAQQLIGGKRDGLNTLIPIEYYSQYNSAWTNIAIPESKALAIPQTNKLSNYIP